MVTNKGPDPIDGPGVKPSGSAQSEPKSKDHSLSDVSERFGTVDIAKFALRMGYIPNSDEKKEPSSSSGIAGKSRLEDDVLKGLYKAFGDLVLTGDTGGDTPSPYQIRKLKDRDNPVIYVPENIVTLVKENPSLSILVTLATIAGYDILKSEKPAKTTKSTAETAAFWKAFIIELSREEPPEELHFKGGKSSAQGTSAARIQLMKVYLQKKKCSHLYQFVSPAIFESTGETKVEILTLQLKMLQVAAQGEVTYLESSLRTLIMAVAALNVDKWVHTFDAYKVPVNEAIKGLHQTKEKIGADKKTKTFVSVPPRRPSERAEVLFQWERDLIVAYEDGVFLNYKEFMGKANAEKGVSLLQLADWRASAKQLISQAWDIVHKFSAHLTKRRNVIESISKKMDKKRQFVLSNENLKSSIRSYFDFLDSVDSVVGFIKDLQVFRSFLLIEELPSTSRTALSSVKFSDNNNSLVFNYASDTFAEYILEQTYYELVGVAPKTIIDGSIPRDFRNYLKTLDDSFLVGDAVLKVP